MTFCPDSVFCDYLSVTYSPQASMADEARQWFLDRGAYTDFTDGGKSVLRFASSSGSVHCEDSRLWGRVSVSGQILASLRAQGIYNEFLNLLADELHRVTRLDASLDVSADAADIVPVLYRSFPTGAASLSHKPLPVVSDLCFRPLDGRESGTVYIGKYSKARISACVYDKALEAFQKRGEVLPPTTRYELRFTGGHATLRDAADPSPIFWAYASPVLLSPPPGHTPRPWVPGGDFCHWLHERKVPSPDDRLSARVQHSADLPEFVRLAADIGPLGRQRLETMIRKRLDALFRAAESLDSQRPIACPPGTDAPKPDSPA